MTWGVRQSSQAEHPPKTGYLGYLEFWGYLEGEVRPTFKVDFFDFFFMITVSIIYGPHTIWNPNFWLHEPSWSLAAIFGFLNLVVLWIFLNCDPCCLKELRKITPKVLHIFKQKKQLTCPPRCNSVRYVQQRLPTSPAFPCSPPPPTLPCVRFCRCRAGEWGQGRRWGWGGGSGRLMNAVAHG